jgi:hypothetical protein
MSSIAYRSADGARPARSRDRVIIASYSVIAIGTLLVLYVIYGSAGEYTAHFELATVSPKIPATDPGARADELVIHTKKRGEECPSRQSVLW